MDDRLFIYFSKKKKIETVHTICSTFFNLLSLETDLLQAALQAAFQAQGQLQRGLWHRAAQDEVA